jgi:hypothetical protein
MDLSPNLIRRIIEVAEMYSEIENDRLAKLAEMMTGPKVTIRDAAAALEESMRHLGNVLVLLSDLAPEERCWALDNAQAFWNEHNPDGQTIMPTGVGYSLLVHKTYGLDEDFDPSMMPTIPLAG